MLDGNELFLCRGVFPKMDDPMQHFSLKKGGSPDDGYIQNVSNNLQFLIITMNIRGVGGDGDKGLRFFVTTRYNLHLSCLSWRAAITVGSS